MYSNYLNSVLTETQLQGEYLGNYLADVGDHGYLYNFSDARNDEKQDVLSFPSDEQGDTVEFVRLVSGLFWFFSS